MTGHKVFSMSNTCPHNERWTNTESGIMTSLSENGLGMISWDGMVLNTESG